MANYQNLKAAISAAIRTNGNQEITGQVLQDVLNSIVSVIGANYTFAGVATPATNPGTPDQNVIYLAMEGGTYTNFNGTVLPAGISLLMWNGSWTSETVMYGDGGVFDISVYKSSGGTLATYADLSAALGTGGANIPEGLRKGGMSVKFVCSSDNKYLQYFCKAQTFTTDVNSWEKVNLNNEVELINQYVFSLNSLKKHDGAISSSNVWVNAGTGSYKHVVVKVNAGDVINVQALQANTFLGFVKDYITPVDNVMPLFSDEEGYNQRITVPLTETQYTVPSDCKYIITSVVRSSSPLRFVTYKINGCDINTPISQLLSEGYPFGGVLNSTDTIPTPQGKVFYILQSGLYSLGTDIYVPVGTCEIAKFDGAWSYIHVEQYSDSQLDNMMLNGMSGLHTSRGAVNGSNQWTNLTNSEYGHYALPVKGLGKITVKVHTSILYYCFVKSYSVVAGQTLDLCSGCTREEIAKNTVTDITVPADANYIILYYKRGSSAATSVFDLIRLDDSDINYALGVTKDCVPMELAQGVFATKHNAAISWEKKWTKVGASGYELYFVPVTPGQVLKIRMPNGHISFNSNQDIIEGQLAGVTGDTSLIPSGVGQITLNSSLYTFTIPSDVKYAVIWLKYNNTVANIDYMTIDGTVDYNGIMNNINDLFDRNEELEKRNDIIRKNTQYRGTLNIAYSQIGIAPINTEEHFLTAAHVGFNSLKADIEITSDNVLVCCHDSGFTFDGDGRITSFDAADNTPIHSMTWNTISELEYAEKPSELGHYAKVCTIDRFLYVCKEYNVIPYITVRDTNVADVLTALVPLLKKYGFQDTAIINKFPFSISIAKQIRAALPNIQICMTNITAGADLTTYLDEIILLGNVSLCIDASMITGQQNAIEKARNNNMPVYAIPWGSASDYQELLRAGLDGGQIATPIMDYHKKSYAFSVGVNNDVLRNDVPFNKPASGKFSASIEYDAINHIISVSNIAKVNSGADFADGILDIWFDYLPYNLSVRSLNGLSPTIKRNGNSIDITLDSSTDLVDFCVEI